ncbi:MAG: hypothetical protein HZB38_13560 [Planctomycetes bacterium]|nr:hypothetical protein [Planctomycetota bacterium]
MVGLGFASECSNLVSSIQFKSGATVQVQTDRSYESDRDLVAAIENKTPAIRGSQTISKYDYADPAQPPAYGNDALGRRTSCVRTGAAFDGQNGAASEARLVRGWGHPHHPSTTAATS